MRLTLLRLLSGTATVLAIAAVAYVVRGAVDVGASDGPTLPVSTPVGAAGTFTLRSAGDNVVPKGAALIATAKGSTIRVYERPVTVKRAKRARSGKAAGGAKRAGKASAGTKLLKQRVFNKQRIPLTFLVVSRRKGWLRVELPTRPNQSRGWIRRTAVTLSFTTMRIVVRRGAHRIRLYDGKRVVMTRKIAVGEAISPTPAGRYFVTDIIRAKRPEGFYGPYALGLSAHSNVYTSFAGGNGQVGIHGTNDPSALGTDVSRGCVRVRNDVIAELAKLVPIGTPVTIRA
ncbi:MAG: L,D-transpeptidase [Solirubrobacterales bacterium]|nr:L,D-transpeptidase [Solirubrobacterales bacterium]